LCSSSIFSETRGVDRGRSIVPILRGFLYIFQSNFY
jgi:hypothetical protein